MNPWIATAISWLHLSSVITVLGGSIYVRLVMMPSVNRLPPEAREEFERSVRKRAIPVIHGGILVLLLSGFGNVARVFAATSHPPAYTILLLVKILLGIGVITLAALLSVRAEGMDSFTRHRGTWMLATIALGLVVVAISAYISMMPTE